MIYTPIGINVYIYPVYNDLNDLKYNDIAHKVSSATKQQLDY